MTDVDKELITLKQKLIYEEYVLINKRNKYLLKYFRKFIKNNQCFKNMKLSEINYGEHVIIYNKIKITIEIYNDFMKLLGQLFKLQMRNNNLTYRGHANANYQLVSSLLREEENLQNEDKIYFDIIKAFPEKFSNARYHLDYLKTIQHYNGKTRIMDLTTNFLIALYFATSSNNEVLGELIIFDKNIDKHLLEKFGPRYIKKVKRLNSDTIEILASLAALDYESKESIEAHAHSSSTFIDSNPINEFQYIEIFNEYENVQRLVHEVGQVRLNFLPKIDPRHLLDVYFSDSTFDNERITNQAGEFIIHGLLPKNKVMKKLNKYRYKAEGKKRIILIDNKAKNDMLEHLQILNIKESTIYPSLENTIKEIYKNYQS
ncbi:FRG domain-containing protein [Salinicoccus halodurans]|uniref:FRG domain-containing protein n=1 Tax=Salinicoccus halodurans TaxID=407035 RepID=A0A0F7HJD3_9STAP|nr:FRG domain-containing protein [Salinicoccus halodurans]AKG73466.1 hypothetical protein AAT16_04100 [Salinicoccus halodurans]SFK51009.1 FRG domain-containing protein [Salinicoccus halodurans]